MIGPTIVMPAYWMELEDWKMDEEKVLIWGWQLCWTVDISD